MNHCYISVITVAYFIRRDQIEGFKYKYLFRLPSSKYSYGSLFLISSKEKCKCSYGTKFLNYLLIAVWQQVMSITRDKSGFWILVHLTVLSSPTKLNLTLFEKVSLLSLKIKHYYTLASEKCHRYCNFAPWNKQNHINISMHSSNTAVFNVVGPMTKNTGFVNP